MIRHKNHKIRIEEKEDIDEAENKDIELNVENITKILSKNSDVIFRKLYINGYRDLPVTLIFIDGLVNKDVVNESILKPLSQDKGLSSARTEAEVIGLISYGAIYNLFQETRATVKDCIKDILNGAAALIFDGEKTAVTFDVKGFEKRSITEPTGENVIKGSKDAFVEVLRTNTATVRRKIKSRNLVVEEMILGEQSMTAVAIIYLDGIANKKIVDEVKKRLGKICVDGILTTGIIEEMIVDNRYLPFPQILATERPDKLCSNILEGRVGLLIDGIPITYIIPGSFVQFLQAPEDYAQNYVVSSAIRSLRYVLAHISLLLPAFYVAITRFHQEMIPSNLAESIKSSREGVPFPSFVEVIFLLIAFEILIEAGLRLPKSIGQAISVVGALVVGQAAVTAKLVSPSVVVVIAITAISSFTMPNQDFSNSLRIWRFLLVILSSIIGLFGLSVGWLVLLFLFCRMESFGVPYLSPLVADEDKQLQDTVFRFPYNLLKKRPINLKTKNKLRQE